MEKEKKDTQPNEIPRNPTRHNKTIQKQEGNRKFEGNDDLEGPVSEVPGAAPSRERRPRPSPDASH